jgi:hypothetical protein
MTALSWVVFLALVGLGLSLIEPRKENTNVSQIGSSLHHISPDFEGKHGRRQKRRLQKRGIQVKTGQAVPFAPRAVLKRKSLQNSIL